MAGDARKAYVYLLKKAFSGKFKHGQTFQFQGAFPEDMCQTTLEDMIADVDGCQRVRAQWRCFEFTGRDGDAVFAKLAGLDSLPILEKDGMRATLVGVTQLAYGRLFRFLRMRCHVALSRVR